MTNTVKRLVTIEMDATVGNFDRMMKLINTNQIDSTWKVTTSLSQHPKDGEIWKDGYGQEYLLKFDPAFDARYPFRNINESKTWKEDGTYHSSDWSSNNLVERVGFPKLDIRVGEYWVDRGKNVHLITCVDVGGDFPIRSSLNLSWTSSGTYLTNGSNGMDLVRKLDLECYIGK